MSAPHPAIEAINYATDARVRERGAQGPTVTICDYENDCEWEVPIPETAYTWQVCSLCDGEGKHVNPSIDCNGLSAQDFAEDPDFAEAYWRGDYDETCRRCNGRTTERVVNYEAFLSPDELRLLEAMAEADARDEAERLAELRMGA